MPLSAPAVARTPQHHRRIHFHSFLREDGLWDIEGELHDSKSVDVPFVNRKGLRKAGEPIHSMWIRVTVDTGLVVQSIEAAMDAHPLGGCPSALAAMQKMVGSCMGRGWRQSIDTHLGKEAGCTHMRELLQSMATAAFQSIFAAFAPQADQPPRFLGQCKGWAFDGAGVAEFYPQFVDWRTQPPVA